MMKTPVVSVLLLSASFVAALSSTACKSSKDGNSIGGNQDGGSTPSGTGGQSSGATRPCDAELKALCGAVCTPKQACPNGLYCMGGTCTADCTKAGKQCSGTCTADGHCVPNDDTPNVPTGDAGGDASMTCIDQQVQFESLTPTVELLIDRSDSMTEDFGNGQDRWDTIRDILVDPDNGFIKRLESKVRFGLALYTGFTTNNQCPDLTEVPFALDNYQMIHDVFEASGTGDNTPTAESLTAVTQELVNYNEVGPKFIVLATDGDPDTCADPNSNGDPGPRAASLASVQDAWNKHIGTFVIGVGGDTARPGTQQHLQDLAHAGQGGKADAMPYQANDANALTDAFNAILSGVVSCDFDLNGEVDPADADQGNVSVGGTRLVYQDPNGYEMPTTTSVRLLGDACDSLKQAVISGNDAQVNITFPCGKITIIR